MFNKLLSGRIVAAALRKWSQKESSLVQCAAPTLVTMGSPLLISLEQPRVIVKSYKHRLILKPEQEEFIRQCLGQQRLLYNLCLESRRNARLMKCSPPTEYDLHKQFTELRNDPEYAWFKSVPIHVQRQGIRNYFNAVNRFYKDLSDYPKPHKRKSIESFLLVRDYDTGEQGNHAQYARVRVPKLGWLKVKPSHGRLKRLNKLYEGEPKSISIQRDGEHYYVSITSQITREVSSHSRKKNSKQGKHKAGLLKPVSELRITGIDLGITRSITLDNGEYYDLPVMTPRETERLTRLQQKLAKQTLGSKNRAKTKLKISRLYQRVRYRMTDAQHQLTRKLVNENDAIGIENLKVKNMSKNTSGTPDNPGTNVAATSGRNREIQKQGWYRFRQMLEYKAAWEGKHVVVVNPAYTSQECSSCSHKSEDNRLTQAGFKCVECGHSENADVNAARVIRGRAIIKLTTPIALQPTTEASPVVKPGRGKPHEENNQLKE